MAERHFKKLNATDWAVKCLEKSYDSKSLQMLASTSKWDSDSEIDNYYQRSLKELGWDKIEKEECLINYAKILAKEIIEDKSDPIETSRIIYKIWIDLDYPPELNECPEIDEMIWDYDHFVKTGEKNHFFRPKEQIISEIKKVSEELVKSK